MISRVWLGELMANGDQWADRKTVVVATTALVGGMIFSLMFQGQLPFQQRTEANSQFDTINQKIGEDRIEISALRERMDNAQNDSNRAAMETQKSLDDIKVQLVAIQTRLDMMDSGQKKDRR